MSADSGKRPDPRANLTVGRLMVVIAAVAVGIGTMPHPIGLVYATFVLGLATFAACRPPFARAEWTDLMIFHAAWLAIILLASWG